MIELFLLATIFLLFLVLFFFYKKISSLKKQFNELQSQKISQAVKYGKLTEQFVPFIEEFPFEPANFRFLGNPIDGIAFNEDNIVFCEFKAGESSLNQKQKAIKKLVEEKKIKWFAFKLK